MNIYRIACTTLLVITVRCVHQDTMEMLPGVLHMTVLFVLVQCHQLRTSKCFITSFFYNPGNILFIILLNSCKTAKQVICFLCHRSFADSCEVTRDGASINCDCQEGYIGQRCERCASGYYGQPEVLGESSIDATGPFTLLMVM